VPAHKRVLVPDLRIAVEPQLTATAVAGLRPAGPGRVVRQLCMEDGGFSFCIQPRALAPKTTLAGRTRSSTCCDYHEALAARAVRYPTAAQAHRKDTIEARLAAGSRWRWGARPATGDDVSGADRAAAYCEFEHPLGHHPAASGVASVEAEHELVQVAVLVSSCRLT